MSAHVLVVDDEARIREVVQYALEREGYRVTAVGDGRAAVETAEAIPFDLVVLDVMLPELDGLSVCRRIREGARTPILFLSARGDELDRVLGLEIGGDDYLTKPFSPRELVARVRAILRRADPAKDRAAPGQVLRHAEVHIDLDRHEVRVKETAVHLTRTELGVLAALLERPGIVLSRAQLMKRAYPYDNLVTDRTIDTHVRRIRAKFREVGAGDPIATVHGVGYKATCE